MQISLELSTEQCGLILEGLNELPHKKSRTLIDYIVKEHNDQEAQSKVDVSMTEEEFESLPKELVEN
jgi:hypothetical protein